MQIPADLYDARNQFAWFFRGRRIAVLGDGANGSQIAALLAFMGANLALFDNDVLTVENLSRTFADPAHVQKNKAFALAHTIRPLIPSDRHIRVVPADLAHFNHRELCEELRDISLVANTTGDRNVGAQINRACRDMTIPLVTPGMFPENDPLIADLHITRWDRPPLTAGCPECLRPPHPGRPGTLDAQRSSAAEVISVASITTLAIVGILAPESVYGQWIDRHAAHGATYHIIHRWPLRMQAVRNRRRRGCSACALEAPRPARVERPTMWHQIDTFIRGLAEERP